jgi:hypothetical protein
VSQQRYQRALTSLAALPTFSVSSERKTFWKISRFGYFAAE